MRKRNYELYDRELKETKHISPKDMTKLFASQIIFSAARLKIGESIDIGYKKLICVN